MPQSPASGTFVVRDIHGASRAVAYLTLAAAPFVVLTGLILPAGVGVAAALAVVTTAVLTATVGTLCWARPHVFPAMFWWLAPLLATAVITGLNRVTNDPSVGAQLFYLWPVLYAASFLSRRVTYFNIAAVSAGDASVVFVLEPASMALSDLFSITLAMSMSGVVVLALRDRADRLRVELERQAHADALTGLANRRRFDRELVRSGTWARRHRSPLALLTIDVDHFKEINDTWGHAAGDQTLRAIGAAVTAVTPEKGIAARLGGDEFVVLIHDDLTTALDTARALEELVAAIGGLPGGPPSLSIGVAVLPDDADTVDALLTASDRALYRAKEGGRGRVATCARVTDIDASTSRTVRQGL